ncbi:MAG: class I SAM-dependent methyltransferase [bacterium]|nr:class I SAM-dependent methyltransferase [bacterium]
MERNAFKLLSDMEKSWWYRGRAAAIHAGLAKCGAKRAEDVLDFGAGYGGMYKDLSRIGKNIYAYEPDAEAREAASKRGYLRALSTESEALGRAYDLIGLFDVVEHIEHDREFLVKAHGALKSGGHLAITVPAFQFLWGIHDVNHHHFRRYTKASMRAVLNDAGFEVEYASYWNMLLFIPAALMRLLGRSGDSSLRMPRLLNAIFFAVVKIESMLIRFISLPFGTGLLIIARKRPQE